MKTSMFPSSPGFVTAPALRLTAQHLAGVCLLSAVLLASAPAFPHVTAKGEPGPQHPEGGCAGAPDESSSSFFYVSFVQGMVGGMPGAARSIYLDDAGDLEVSEFTTNGVLRRLVRAGGLASSFGALRSLLEASHTGVTDPPREAEPPAAGEDMPLVTDYYPPATVYAFRLGGRMQHFEELADDSSPPGVSDAIALLEKLAADLPSSQNRGLFVRAEPVELERKPDIRIEETSKGSDDRLQRLLSRPLKLVRISSETSPQLVGHQFVIEAGQAILVEDRGCMYFLHAYASTP